MNGIKINNKIKKSVIHPKEMNDGQIGVVVQWNDFQAIGAIVQAYGDELITIGMTSYFTYCTRKVLHECCLVRILKQGTLLEIL